jgi:hypothetical protein
MVPRVSTLIRRLHDGGLRAQGEGRVCIWRQLNCNTHTAAAKLLELLHEHEERPFRYCEIRGIQLIQY